MVGSSPGGRPAAGSLHRRTPHRLSCQDAGCAHDSPLRPPSGRGGDSRHLGEPRGPPAARRTGVRPAAPAQTRRAGGEEHSPGGHRLAARVARRAPRRRAGLSQGDGCPLRGPRSAAGTEEPAGARSLGSPADAAERAGPGVLPDGREHPVALRCDPPRLSAGEGFGALRVRPRGARREGQGTSLQRRHGHRTGRRRAPRAGRRVLRPGLRPRRAPCRGRFPGAAGVF